jgi:signal transduction histidine kinase
MWRLGLVGLAGLAVGLAAELVGGNPGASAQWILDLATGWTLIGCGLVAVWKHPEGRTGWLMVATGFTWFLTNFAEVRAAAIAWLATHAVYLHRGPLVHLLLTYPSWRSRSQLTRGAIAVGYAAAIITPIWRNEAATIILAALLVVVCARVYVRSIGWLRRARRIALQAATGLSLVLAGTAAARMLLPAGDVSVLSLVLYEVTLCLLAGGLLAGLLAAPWQRVLVADLVVELGEARSDTLRGELARALGDRSLELGYWLPDRRTYVDTDGSALTLPTPSSNRSMTVLERGGQPVAALVHDPAVLDDPGLVEAVSSAAQLAAANAQLRAEVQSQVEELAASRSRILEAADEQRRQLESRLHDGAAARLRGTDVILRSGRRSATGEQTRAEIAHAEDQLQHTLEELHRLANGLHPRVLTEQGLSDALADLVRDVPLQVSLEVTKAELPARVAAAAYFIFAEALSNAAKHAAASRITVVVTTSDGRINVEIADDGVGGADASRGSGLRGLADRFEALGGGLLVDSVPGHGTRLAAEIPLDGETGLPTTLS